MAEALSGENTGGRDCLKTSASKQTRPTTALPHPSRYTYQPISQIDRIRRAGKQGDLHPLGVQAKLRVGQANDKYEQEADRVAEHVLRMPATEYAQPIGSARIQPMRIQRMCESCEEDVAQRQPEDEDEELQTKATPGQAPRIDAGIESGIKGLKGGGRPLDAATRSFFEPRFGYDFSQVRVHADHRAAANAGAINARAFTLGRDIVFNSGEYQPRTPAGRRLLGHELTHCLQQTDMPVLSGTHNRAARQTSEPGRTVDSSPVIQREPEPRPKSGPEPDKTPAPRSKPKRARRKKVLVTGFNDWQNLGTPPNIWKCDENPSCRLLTGNPTTSRPTSYAGPLVSTLRATRSIDWKFKTLPTVWGIAARSINYRKYDAVINMGLGVYNTRDEIQLEQNAYNERANTPDAAGNLPSSTRIDATNTSGTLVADPRSGVNRRIMAMNQRQLASRYRARVAQARQTNNYICNETHYHGLSEMNRSLSRRPPGRLKLAYFIHLPRPRTSTAYGDLASGTADVIRNLLR